MTEMKPKKQLAHLFNATRCIGCTACMNASLLRETMEYCGCTAPTCSRASARSVSPCVKLERP